MNKFKSLLVLLLFVIHVAYTLNVASESDLVNALSSYGGTSDLELLLTQDISVSQQIFTTSSPSQGRSVVIKSNSIFYPRTISFDSSSAQLLWNTTHSLSISFVTFVLNSNSTDSRLKFVSADSSTTVVIEQSTFLSNSVDAQQKRIIHSSPFISLETGSSSKLLNISLADTSVESMECATAVNGNSACFLHVQHRNSYVNVRNVTAERIINSGDAGFMSINVNDAAADSENVKVEITDSMLDYSYGSKASILNVAKNSDDGRKVSVSFARTSFDRNYNINTKTYPKSLISASNGQVDISFDRCDFTGNTVTESVLYHVANGTLKTSKGSFLSSARVSADLSAKRGSVVTTGNLATLDIAETTFSKNNGTNGGIITVGGAARIASGAWFWNNNADSIVSLGGSKDVTISRVKFESNTGASILADSYTGTATAEHSQILNNKQQNGGAVQATASSLNLVNTTISGSQSSTGGCAVSSKNSIIRVQDSSIAGNCLNSANAAITAESTNLWVSGTTFSNNGRALELTGACVSDRCTSATFSGCTFSNNGYQGLAEAGVASISKQNATVTFDSCTVTGSSATRAGAILAKDRATVTIRKTAIASSVATLGAAIYADSAATVSLDQATISNNQGCDKGCGIYVGSANVNVDNSTFTSNIALSYGSAIYVDQSCISITNSKFSNNGDAATDRGGAIYFFAPTCQSKVESSSFNGNTAEEGGAVSIAAPTTPSALVTFTQCTFKTNTSPRGGAVAARDKARVKISGGNFVANSANEGGAVLLIGESVSEISNAMFANNTVASFPFVGGAFSISEKAQATFSGNTFDSNTAGTVDSSGGAVFINVDANSAVSFTGDSFVKNTAVNGGAFALRKGKISFNNVVNVNANGAVSGGIIYAPGSAEVTIQGSTFTDNVCLPTSSCSGPVTVSSQTKLTVSDSHFINTANLDSLLYKPSSGGFVAADGQTTLSFTNTKFSKAAAAMGGLVFSSTSGAVTFDGCTFEFGSAASGAGVYLSASSSVNTVVIKNSKFTQNTATGAGAALYVAQPLVSVKNTIFSNNNAGTGGAIRAVDVANADIQDCEFTDNTGTAAHVTSKSSATLSVSNSVFRRNTGLKAGNQGGGLCVIGKANSNLTLSNIDFESALAILGGGAYLQDINSVVTDVRFKNNIAGDGGAAVLAGTATVSVGNCTFQNNSASPTVINSRRSAVKRVLSRKLLQQASSNGDGGAILIAGNVAASVTGSAFISNSAERNGGGLALTADATNAAVSIASSSVSGNVAASSGGGIYVPPEAAQTVVEIQDVVFALNSAESGGSYFAQSLVCNNCTYSNNTANVGADGASSPASIEASPPQWPGVTTITSGAILPIDIQFTIKDKFGSVLSTDDTTELRAVITPQGHSSESRLITIQPLRATKGIIRTGGKLSLFGWQGLSYTLKFEVVQQALSGVTINVDPINLLMDTCRPGFRFVNASLVCDVCPKDTASEFAGSYQCAPCPCATPAGSAVCQCQGTTVPTQVSVEYKTQATNATIISGQTIPFAIELKSLAFDGSVLSRDNFTTVQVVATSPSNSRYIVRYGKNMIFTNGVLDLTNAVFFYGEQGVTYTLTLVLGVNNVPLVGATLNKVTIQNCQPGFFQNSADLVCNPCSPGQFNPLPGRSTCDICPLASTSNPAATECFCIDQKQYLVNSTCTSCPEHVSTCYKGEFEIEAGYFKFNSTSSAIYQCLSPERCIGGKQLPTTCATGYTGPICASCDTNFAQLLTDCVPCMHLAGNIIIWIFIFLLSLPLIVVFQRAVRYHNPDVMIKMKIFFSYICGIVYICGFTDFKFHWILSGFAHALKTVVLDYENILAHCGIPQLTPNYWLYIHLVIPIIFGVIIPIPIILLFYCIYKGQGKLEEIQLPEDMKIYSDVNNKELMDTFGTRVVKETKRKHNLKSDMILFPLSVLYIATPAVLFHCFQQFSCSSIIEGTSFFTWNWHVKCDAAHGAPIAVGAVAIFVYGILLPLVGVVITFNIKRKLKEKSEEEVQRQTINARRFRIYYGGYRERYYFWELVVFIRKVAVVAVIALITHPLVEGVVLLAILCVALFLQGLGQPNLRRRYTRLEVVSLLAQATTVALGLLSLGGFAAQIVATVLAFATNIFALGVFVVILIKAKAFHNPAMFVGEGFKSSVDKRKEEVIAQELSARELQNEELGV